MDFTFSNDRDDYVDYANYLCSRTLLFDKIWRDAGHFPRKDLAQEKSDKNNNKTKIR